LTFGDNGIVQHDLNGEREQLIAIDRELVFAFPPFKLGSSLQ